MRIVVGSMNLVKLDMVKDGYRALFSEDVEVYGSCAKSGVPDQPFGREQTMEGAKNRAYHARDLEPNADFWVGVEGGVEDLELAMYEFTAIYIVPNKPQADSCCYSVNFPIPTGVAELIRGGMEHGPACDRFFGVMDSKHGYGTIGIVTKNVLTRTSYVVPAVICAFIPYRNPGGYY